MQFFFQISLTIYQDKKNLTINSTTTPIKDIIIKITNIL